MTRPGLILVGGGGHCRSVLDAIRLEGRWDVKGILDRADKAGSQVDGCPVIGDDDSIPGLASQGYSFLVTAGQVKDASLRLRLASLIRDAGGRLATVVSPRSYVASSAVIAPGAFIGHLAVVNAASRIGANTIINTCALVEHDAEVGAHCHVATGAIVNGECKVGDGSLIGSRAVLLQGVHVGIRCIVGAGAVVLRDVPDGRTAVGQPARLVA
jgi:sugar O-acyltransferase (sialic acid O-acetyltransferase NeuD family)